MKRKNDNWQPTDSRFVAFLDILGFKDKVQRKNHQEVYNELKTLSDIQSQLKTILSKDENSGRLQLDDIYIVNFSDSIIIFSKNDSIESLKVLLYSLRFILYNSIVNKIAIKGGIAHGLITVNKSSNLFVGQPIIDAYSIEEEVNYLGVTCHSSIDLYLSSIEKQFRSFLDILLFNYKTPLKSGSIFHTNLDWFETLSYVHYDDSKENFEKAIIERLEKLYETVSGSPRRYIDNSIDLFKSLLKDDKMNVIPII